MLKKAINITFGAFLFLLPFKIQTVLLTTPIFLQGQFNPYTTFFLTLPDIILTILLILIGAEYVSEKHTQKNKYILPKILLFIFIVVSFASFFWTQDKEAVISNGIRLILGTLIPFLFLNSGYFKEKKEFLIKIFIISMGLQALIGILQFILQHSIGFYLLGESHISPSELGIAKIDILNKKIIRSYATFPHPNIFGAFLVLAAFLTTKIIKENKFKFPLILLFILALIFTFSRSAWIAAGTGLIIFVSIHRKTISWPVLLAGIGLVSIVTITLTPLISNRFDLSKDISLKERLNGIKMSLEITKKNPFGIGAGSFTRVLQNYTQEKLAPWEYQPVHNTFLLTMTESGIQGIIILFAFVATIIIYAIRQNKEGLIYGCALLILMMFDHYFLTIPQGQSLLALLSFFTIYRI